MRCKGTDLRGILAYKQTFSKRLHSHFQIILKMVRWICYCWIIQ